MTTTTDPTTQTPATPEVDQNLQTAPATVDQGQPAEGSADDSSKLRISKVLAEKVKAEKALNKKRLELKAEKAALEKERAEIEAFKASKAAARKDPIKYLEEAGLTYDELTQVYLNGGQPPADLQVKEVRNELEAYKRQEEERRKSEIEAHEAALKARRSELERQYLDQVTTHVKTAGEKYELINTLGEDGFKAVHDHVVFIADTEGRVATEEEAAEHIENQFYEQLKTYAATKKFKQLMLEMQPKPPTPAKPSTEKRETQLVNQRKTMHTGITASTAGSEKPLDRTTLALKTLQEIEAKRKA